MSKYSFPEVQTTDGSVLNTEISNVAAMMLFYRATNKPFKTSLTDAKFYIEYNFPGLKSIFLREVGELISEFICSRQRP